MNKSLSIIIPVYGVEKYINDFLDSFLPQLNDRVDCIFVNDGTKDNSIKILEEKIKKNKIDCKIVNQSNGGVSKARNAGLEIAKGGFITFLDPDDIVLEGYIESILDIIDQNDDVDIIHFNAEVRCLNGDIGKINFVEDTASYIIDSDFKLKCFKKNFWQPWLRVFKSDIFNGKRFTEGVMFEDLILFPFVYEDGLKVYEINKQLVTYRLNENSLTYCKNEFFFKSISAAIDLYRNYKDIPHLRFIYIHLLDNLYGIQLRHSYIEFSQFCKKYKEDLIYINKNVEINSIKMKFKWASPKLFFIYKTRFFMKKLKNKKA